MQAFQEVSRTVTAVANTGAPQGSDARDFSDFLFTARRRFKFTAEAEAAIRLEALDDLRFYEGEQWPDQIRSDRALTNRPCLTMNRLKPIARQIINEQRQMRPAIQVNPVGSGADIETAQIIQGMTRHIEINSDSEIAYDTAFEHAVIHGRGYFRIITDYVDDKSFDQEIKIVWILDPFTVYMDPTCSKPDYSDAQFCFIVEDIPWDRYKEMYGDSNVAAASLADFRSLGDTEKDWFTQSAVRVAEYFWVEEKTVTLVKLVTGEVINDEDLNEDDEIEHRNGEPITRESKQKIVHWCRMNAREVLEENIWPGETIPIIPVLGDQLIVNGRRKLNGIVRFAKDAQRMYNYARTGVVEQIGLSAKAPWIMAEGQEEGHEEEWRQASTRNQAILRYKPKTVGNQPVGPPIRNVFEPPVHALSTALAQSEQDLQGTTGIFNANLGGPGPEQSGKAILARQQKGEQSVSGLIDNMTRAIRRCGRLIVQLIPKVYDVGRVIRIVKPDETHKLVTINEPFEENGAMKLYDVTTGLYDITISVGPSYQSRRVEFVESVLALVKSAPEVMGVVADLLVKNMDWPGAQEISDRLKKMLPPQLQDDEDGQQPVPPQVQAKIAQLVQKMAQDEQVIQQLLIESQALKQTMESKVLDNESRERIAILNAKAKIVAAEMASKSMEAQGLMKHDHAAIEHQLDMRQDLLHAGLTIEADAAQREHEIELAKLAAAAKPKAAPAKR